MTANGHRTGVALTEVERVWRENRCLTEETIVLYRTWSQRFLEHCRRHQLHPQSALTFAEATRFIHQYARGRHVDIETLKNGRTALHRFAEALQTLGEQLPVWRPGVAIRPRVTSRKRSALLEEYAEHMRCYRGSCPSTITVQCFFIEHLLKFLRRRRRSLHRLQLKDIDALLIERRRHWSVRTLANLCVALRGFLRFL